jgi:uncharacterized protein with HEPN domain
MLRDDAYMLDILDSARIALQHVAGKTQADFDADIQCQDAVIRRFEIIGEAAGRVSEETKQKYSHLPWKEMKYFRNLVIHRYDSVDYSQVWGTVQNDLPVLIEELEKILPHQ